MRLANKFATAFEAQLALLSPQQDWQARSRRTEILKGTSATRRQAPLHKVFSALDFAYHTDHGATQSRVFQYEWHNKDIVAANGLGRTWADACWRGRYFYEIVCELENDLPEIELTMRGMFDLRARLSVGIFFARVEDPQIGPKFWSKGSDESRPLSQWSPPTGGSDDFPWHFAEGDEVLLLLVSDREPKLLRAITFEHASGNWTSK